MMFTGIGCHDVVETSCKDFGDTARSSANIVRETPSIAMTAMVVPIDIIERSGVCGSMGDVFLPIRVCTSLELTGLYRRAPIIASDIRVLDENLAKLLWSQDTQCCLLSESACLF